MKRFPRPLMTSLAACWAVAACASPSFAQSLVSRLAGTVKTITNQPIKAATIRAVNPSVIPSEFTTATDQKGEWAIMGVRGGIWEITASAPGFETSTVAVRVTSGSLDTPKLQFVLMGTPVKGAMDGIDTRRVQESLSTAESLMAQGKWDDAIAAYRAILAMAPPLDMVNLAIGRALRMKKDYAGAAAAYGEVLKRDARNQKALLELGRVQQEQGDKAAAIATLEKLIAIDATTDEAAEARQLLHSLGK